MTNGRHTRFLDALKRVFQVVTAPDFLTTLSIRLNQYQGVHPNSPLQRVNRPTKRPREFVIHKLTHFPKIHNQWRVLEAIRPKF